MTMKEICSIFLSLLWYIPYVIHEKQKIQCFLSFFPIMFKVQNEYDNLKTLEGLMIKENLFYDQNKNKKEKINQFGRQKDEINLIKERKVINHTKTQGLIIKGIKAVILNVLNHKTL